MDQSAMRDFWLSAPEGRLSAWELAKALAFREASRELSGGEVNLAWVALQHVLGARRPPAVT